jgi:hypothetical protein
MVYGKGLGVLAPPLSMVCTLRLKHPMGKPGLWGTIP